MLNFGTLLAFGGLFGLTLASPFPQTPTPTEGEDGSLSLPVALPGATEAIEVDWPNGTLACTGNVADCVPECILDPEDPNTWVNNGWPMLRDWVEKNGDPDWFRKMFQNFNPEGHPGIPTTINCAEVDSNACPIPGIEMSCPEFFPDTNFYWVRHYAGMVNSNFARAHDLLTEGILSTSLNIGQIVQDFKPPAPEEDQISKILAIIGGGLGAAGSVAGMGSPVAGGLFGLIGGAFSIAGTITDEDPEVPDYDALQAKMTSYLNVVLTEMRKQLQKGLREVFGEGEEADFPTLRGLWPKMSKSPEADSAFATNPVLGYTLNTGDMLRRFDNDTFTAGINLGMSRISHALIGQMLAFRRFFVFTWPASREVCEGLTTNRWYAQDGRCYVLLERPLGQTERTSDLVPQETITLMEQTYGINLDKMYENANLCNNAERPTEFTFPNDGSYPPCYFGLPVFRSDSSCDPGCNPTNLDTLPDFLNDDSSDCQGADYCPRSCYEDWGMSDWC